MLYCSNYIRLYYFYFLWLTSTKPQAEILRLSNVNGCDDISFIIIITDWLKKVKTPEYCLFITIYLFVCVLYVLHCAALVRNQ